MEIKDIRLQNLKHLMNRENMTQTELALRCELSPSVISQVITGRRNLGSNLSRKIEENLRLGHGWLDVQHDIISNIHMTARRKQSENELKKLVEEMPITNQEKRLLELFRQMPASEKQNIIIDLSEKKRKYDVLLDELIAVKDQFISSEVKKNNKENNE
ncbi:helix-turn-helix domain-containing protein [Pantoea sp. JZ2]|uniref:helix-turn-helix domain-containing protein n=1 Tax=Pantoea sp. JZ2 TaxID=2654189 RepID=UPI002B492AE9|nr:helix-turn-helix domain-containing protein [Pantoea sp. JZ2]WRH12313.1 helix-turn-helix domain-containing protein [Pantoea sp. JZ2]